MYTITTSNHFGPMTTATSRIEATRTARRMATENQGENVYIQLATTQGAACYLNPCGNFESVGRSWQRD